MRDEILDRIFCCFCVGNRTLRTTQIPTWTYVYFRFKKHQETNYGGYFAVCGVLVMHLFSIACIISILSIYS